MPSSTTFRANCHCGSFNEQITLPTSAFPLKSALCHCDTCRQVSGHLFATFAVIPGPAPDASFLTKLAKYSSPFIDRYFCLVCGASVLNVDKRDGEWEVCTGALEFEGQEKGKGPLDGRLNRAFLWTEDTKDGGAVHWLNEGRAEGLAGRFMQGRSSEPVTEEVISGLLDKAKAVKERGDVLKGSCHCGEVKIHVLAPESEDDKHSAEFCCCDSCRKTSGFEINAWTHVEKPKVIMADGSPYEVGMKDMGLYKSSTEVSRYFCRKCGATVFYDRPGLKRLDIGLGLFSAPEGSRADNWFRWNPDWNDVSYLEDAVDKEFVGRLADGVGSATRKPGEERVPAP